MELLLALLLLVPVLLLVHSIVFSILLVIIVLMFIQRNSLEAFGPEANMNAEPSAMPHAVSANSYISSHGSSIAAPCPVLIGSLTTIRRQFH